MLAGCSSTLLSPRHRLRSEASAAAQFVQACHYPSMSTQRLDLPYNSNFPRKDVSSKPQSVRNPVGLSLEKPPIEVKSLKQSIKVPPSPEIKAEFSAEDRVHHHHQSLKKRRFENEDEDDEDESHVGRIKRKKGSFGFGESEDYAPAPQQHFWAQQPGFGVINYPQQLPFPVTCSGEEEEEGDEERLCFAPSIPPWVDSGAAVLTTQYGGRTTGEPDRSHGFGGATSGSNSSSETDSYGVIQTTSSDPEFRNGSGLNPNPAPPGTVQFPHQTEQQGFELISFLISCVEAIGSHNIGAINHSIARLGELASPRARSALARIAAYYTEALAIRAARSWPHIFHVSIPRDLDRFDDESVSAVGLRLLNQITPVPKFLHFTANEMLLRAFQGKDRIHVIDFDIKHGLQWAGFLQSLSARPDPPSHVRITGVGESKQELIETGERLSGIAELFNIEFSFHPVVDRLEDVRLWMLHVKGGEEAVAINCILSLHKTLYDPTTFRDFMGLIRSTNPIALVLGEQEASHNEPGLESRVCNSLRYYAAIFDTIDSTLPYDSPARVKIEEMFGREIRNIVACEGGDRVERHERFGRWKRRMEEEGFRCLGKSEREVVQSRMLLRMYPNENYNVQTQEEGSGITLGWLDQPLYTVSLWGPSEFAAGSSSSFSMPS